MKVKVKCHHEIKLPILILDYIKHKKSAPSNSSNFFKYRLVSIGFIKVEKDLQATPKVLG
jgi:hypothetical protein